MRGLRYRAEEKKTPGRRVLYRKRTERKEAHTYTELTEKYNTKKKERKKVVS